MESTAPSIHRTMMEEGVVHPGAVAHWAHAQTAAAALRLL